MHADITCARAVLRPDDAAAEIDRVLVAVRDEKLPGYLLVPADVAELPADRPTAPLPAPVDVTDPEVRGAFTDAAGRLLARAVTRADVGVLAGLLVHRLGAAGRLTSLLAAKVPHATTPWAKSLVDETAPGFAGTYSGATGSPRCPRCSAQAAGPPRYVSRRPPSYGEHWRRRPGRGRR